jgi:hypothetical protein
MAVILATSGTIKVSETVDLNLIFISIGAVAIACSFVLMLGIKDVNLKKVKK